MATNATVWLSELASNGYCAATTFAGKCATGDRGSFGLPSHARDSLIDAVSWCLSRCESCARCNYIDVTLRWNDCSWHYMCDQQSLRTDVTQVYSGPALRTLRSSLHRGSRRRKGVLPAAAFEAVARKRHEPTACTAPEEEGRGRAYQITEWAGMGAGFNMVGGAFALHKAACCGGSVMFPIIQASAGHGTEGRGVHGHMTMHELLGERNRSCVSFRHLPVTASQEELCAPTQKNAYLYFMEGLGYACPSAQHYWRPALIAVVDHFALSRSLPRCSAEFDNILVAHVRSGDIFAPKTHFGYGQPPLAYYLAAWEHSGLSNLLVVTENFDSPVVRVLRVLENSIGVRRVRVQASGADGFHRDLGTLMCAKNLVLSRSSLSMMLLTNSALRHVYSSVSLGVEAQGVPLWTASCATKVWVGKGVERAANWEASERQKLELVDGNWGARINFTDTKLHCLE